MTKSRILVAATVLLGTTCAMSASAVRAVASTHYVAATGSVGTNSSCSSPGYVGATHVSIQSAIDAAATGDTIHICSGTYAVSTRLNVAKSLTITGSGAVDTILDGGGTTQIMIIQDNAIDDPNSGDEITANINSLTFRNGNATQVGALGECVDGNRCGGGLFVENESRVNINETYFRNNTADFIGGGFARLMSGATYPNVPSTISRSAFEGNRAKFDGGAVATLFGFGLTINRSTFYRNGLLSTGSARSASAIIANFADATVNDSTIVDHNAPSGKTVLYGSITLNRTLVAQVTGSTTNICNGSQTMSGTRANLVTDGSCTGVTQSPASAGAGNSARVAYADLNLGTFGYSGYSIQTVPLLSGSAALNFWTGGSCTGSDQRGVSVPQGASCDVGAYERHASQTLNTPSAWSYGSTPLQRSGVTTFNVVSGSVDPAGQGVTYSSSTQSVCTVDASTGALTAVSTGTCTLKAVGPTYQTRDEDSTTISLSIVEAPATTTTTSTTTTLPATTVPSSTTTLPTTTSSLAASTTSLVTVAPSATTTIATATTLVTVPSGGGSTGTTVATPTTAVIKSSTSPSSVAPAASTSTVPPTTTTTEPAPVTPTVAPGEAGATVDGESVETTLTRVDNSLVVDAGEVSATVYGIDAAGQKVALDADGNLQLSEEDRIVVSASGYATGSIVEVWLRSTPTKIGTVAADALGRISGTFAIPGGIDAGDHRVVLAGRTKSGGDSVIGVGLRIGAYAKESNMGRWIISLAIALAIILALVIPTTARRRKRLNG